MKTGRQFKVASLVALGYLCSSLMPVWAASNLVASSDYDDVARAERVFFGSPDTTNTYLRRLELLEVGIFGRVRSGSAEHRFQRITSALGLTTPDRTSSAGSTSVATSGDTTAAVAPADVPSSAVSTPDADLKVARDSDKKDPTDVTAAGGATSATHEGCIGF